MPLFLLDIMDAIYAKIQVAEDHLRNLRARLQSAEIAYKTNGPSSPLPKSIAIASMPFVESACASAKAALLTSGNRPR